MTGARAPGRPRRPARAPGAASHRESGWNQIDWKRAEREVKRLQQRIAKATMEGRWGKVHALQRLLTRSYSGKVIAVRRATTNRGSKTPGVDGEIWKTPAQKYQAIHRLRARGYQPQPLRRVYIDKRDKKAKRPLGIPTMIDRSMQALYLLALDPVAETTGDRSSYGFRTRRSAHDAIAQCFILLSRQNSPTWILEADVPCCGCRRGDGRAGCAARLRRLPDSAGSSRGASVPEIRALLEVVLPRIAWDATAAIKWLWAQQQRKDSARLSHRERWLREHPGGPG